MLWERRNKISVTPLGGVSGVGHNCFLYVNDGSAVVVDCGIKPQTYEERKQVEDQDDFWETNPNWVDPPPRLDILDEIRLAKKDVIGVITHAHLDHIGAVAELGRRRIPTYLSRWSKRFMERYAGNLKIPVNAEFRVFDGNEDLKHGDFQISFIPLQHSIPGTAGVLLRLDDKKNVLHLGDFKFNGVNDRLEETRRIFREIRSQVGKIHCLVLDVLNAEVEGFTPPERRVFASFERIIKEAPGRVIVSFFSSNLHRMEKLIEIGRSQNRPVGISGWGMSSSHGLLGSYPLPKDGSILLVGGSQGEENSGLNRMARGEHPFLKLYSGDTVIFSSRSIPGNKAGIRMLMENLHRQEARIILHEGEARKLNLRFGVEEEFLHVSGHGQRADLRDAIEILEPEIIIPFHAPEDRYQLFEEMVGSQRKIQRLREGETLEV